LLHSIRCVLMTPFGRPVEPEVKSTLAIVSGPTRSRASSTAGVTSAARAANGVTGTCAGALVDVTTSVPGGSTCASARSKAAPSAAKTRPGPSRSTICRSAVKSFACSE
jgi:hypothetical protein